VATQCIIGDNENWYVYTIRSFSVHLSNSTSSSCHLFA